MTLKKARADTDRIIAEADAEVKKEAIKATTKKDIITALIAKGKSPEEILEYVKMLDL